MGKSKSCLFVDLQLTKMTPLLNYQAKVTASHRRPCNVVETSGLKAEQLSLLSTSDKTCKNLLDLRMTVCNEALWHEDLVGKQAVVCSM